MECGPHHLEHLDSIVDPLVVTDLATVMWSPHGHWEALDSLRRLAQVVLLDSVDDPDVDEALLRACSFSDELYVVDLAWLRSTPWRERIAAAYDPAVAPARPRDDLARSTSATTPIPSSPRCCCSAGWRRGWAGSRRG